jgi:hypothetical protein
MSMIALDIFFHLLNILHGIGASLACFALFYVCGLALHPRPGDPTLNRDEFPGLLGAAVFVLWCWYGIRLDVALTPLIAVFAGLVVVLVGVRRRHVVTALKEREVWSRATLGWVATFGMLYFLAYLFAPPTVSGEHLPLASYLNNDMMNYLNVTRYLQQLGPSNVAGVSLLDVGYWHTPAVFYVVGLFSTLFHLDPMSAAMPVQFAFTALIGVVAARISRSVFGASAGTAAALAAMLVSGPFFRYITGSSFLSTLMSLPILLHLIWTTVALRAGLLTRGVPMAVRFGVAYVLLLFLYPMLFFAGIAAQVAIIGLAGGSSVLIEPPRRASWREAWVGSGKTALGIVAALGVLAACAPLHLWWTVQITRRFSQKGVAGWPLDFISPLALFGVPGNFGLIQVDGPASRAWAMAALCVIAREMTALFFGRFRQRTGVGERVFVGLAAGSLVAYCVYFGLVGPSYQQWKFASYFPLALSFVVFAGTFRLCHLAVASTWVARSGWGRVIVVGLPIIIAAVFVGGNLRMHALVEAQPLRWPSTLSNLRMIDELPYFRELTVQMGDYGSTFFPVYFIRKKTLHLASASYYSADTPVSFQDIWRGRPFLIHNYGCEGIGHEDTVTIPGVGCLLLSPPSLALDTVYPFNRSFLFVDMPGMDAREAWGRWNRRTAVQLVLTADVRRTRVDQNAYVNLLLKPFRLTRQGHQRLVFSWGANRHADAALAAREWISLPLQSTDWTGNSLQTLTVSLDLPDAVPLRQLDLGSSDPTPRAVGFEQISISLSPLGRVLLPPTGDGQH